jgi:hypothetical protein
MAAPTRRRAGVRGRAEEKIAKGNNDAVRLIMRDQQIGVDPEGRAPASTQSFSTAIASQRLQPTRGIESCRRERLIRSRSVECCSASRTLLHQRRRERDRGSSPHREREGTRPCPVDPVAENPSAVCSSRPSSSDPSLSARHNRCGVTRARRQGILADSRPNRNNG